MKETYSTIKKKASIIIKVMNAFTGQPLTNAIVKPTNSNEVFINKKDGFYILLNSKYNNYTVNISFPSYKDEMVIINDVSANKTNIISLLPLEYEGTIKITGNMPEKEKQKIYYCSINKQEQRIIKNSIKGDKSIQVTKSKGIIEGSYFIDSEEGEIVTVIKSSSEEDYEVLELDNPLNVKHKMGDILVRAYYLNTDDEGYFSLLLPKKSDKFKLYIIDTKNEIFEYELKADKEMSLGTLIKKEIPYEEKIEKESNDELIDNDNEIME